MDRHLRPRTFEEIVHLSQFFRLPDGSQPAYINAEFLDNVIDQIAFDIVDDIRNGQPLNLPEHYLPKFWLNNNILPRMALQNLWPTVATTLCYRITYLLRLRPTDNIIVSNNNLYNYVQLTLIPFLSLKGATILEAAAINPPQDSSSPGSSNILIKQHTITMGEPSQTPTPTSVFNTSLPGPVDPQHIVQCTAFILTQILDGKLPAEAPTTQLPDYVHENIWNTAWPSLQKRLLAIHLYDRWTDVANQFDDILAGIPLTRQLQANVHHVFHNTVLNNLKQLLANHLHLRLQQDPNIAHVFHTANYLPEAQVINTTPSPATTTLDTTPIHTASSSNNNEPTNSATINQRPTFTQYTPLTTTEALLADPHYKPGQFATHPRAPGSGPFWHPLPHQLKPGEPIWPLPHTTPVKKTRSSPVDPY